MNKKTLTLLLLLFSFQRHSFSQNNSAIDSLERELKNYKAHQVELHLKSPTLQDTVLVNILKPLSWAYTDVDPAKAMEYAQQCLDLSQEIGYKPGIATSYNTMGVVHYNKGENVMAYNFFKKALPVRMEIGIPKGIALTYQNMANACVGMDNYPEALKNCFAALKINEQSGNKVAQSTNLNSIAEINLKLGNYNEGLKNSTAALAIQEKEGDKPYQAACHDITGQLYYSMGNCDEALKHQLAALKLREEWGNKNFIATSNGRVGLAYKCLGSYTEALKYYAVGEQLNKEIENYNALAYNCLYIGEVYLLQKKYEQSAAYYNKALALTKEHSGPGGLVSDTYASLYSLDSAQGNYKQAFDNHKLYITYRDSVWNTENTKKITQQQMQFAVDKKEQEISLLKSQKEIDKLNYSRRLGINFGLGGALLGVICVALAFYSQNKKTKKINDNLQAAYKKLEDTQEQLIKSEKMAAFGVMASRVSHEIQNPLNFVNNFSEMAEEMVNEMVHSTNEEERKETAKDLITNLQKIKQHGKRADAIVKQLQEHTNKGTAHEFFEKN